MDPRATPAAEELAKVYREVAERASRVLGEYAQHHPQLGTAGDELGIGKAYMELYARMFANPMALAAESMNMWLDYARLWQSSWMKMLGQDGAPVAAPAKGDARFKDEEWSNNFLFDFIKQSYLIASRHIQGAVANVEGLPEEAQKKVAFFTRQYVDALAPSNFVMTNPQVLRETLASGGQNLVKGLNNLLADLEKGDGQLRISMTDEKAFKLGKNVAGTPGKVVFQTDLMQLIQFEPTTQEVFRRPLLIIPPWINKYYILDLRESNSFIRWALGQGHTVFVVSWVNPDKRLADKGFEDYLLEGSLAAIDAVGKATGETKCNVIGYCLGGTLLGCTLAWLAAKGDDRIGCATFFVSLLDFSQPGELGVFIDEEQLAKMDEQMEKTGFFDGSDMAEAFNLLRANDLIWGFVINNYLMGKDPFPFDLLYWNSDSTRMPCRMHSFYLHNMYEKNLLCKPEGISFGDVGIDLSKVKTPAYFISTKEDHIAPWESTYAGTRLLSGPVRFVLGMSGHIAGIVNPPAAKKYGYWTNEELPEASGDWLAGAQSHDGSWWLDWKKWVQPYNGKRVPARMPGDGKLQVIEDAPGSYVKVRAD